MATQVQFRRGTTTENNAFTGAAAELTVDTTLTTVRVHDGTTSGGVALLNVNSAQTVTNKTFAGGNTWEGNAATLAYGGTGDSLTAIQGGIVYSTDSELAIGLAGTAGQVLTSGGTAAPIWVTPSALTVGTASVAASAQNITGGSAGYLVYQYDTDDTSFIQPGLSGYVLQSTGASTAPTWVTSDVTIGSSAVTLGSTVTDFAGLTSIDATTGATNFFTTPTGSTNLLTSASAISIGASTSTTTVNDDLVVTGNLTVNGETTTINSTTLTVDDLNVVLASGATTAAAANGAGITVDGANAELVYSSTGDKWTMNKPLDIDGATVMTSTLDVTADTTLAADLAVNGGEITTTATTFNIVPENATTVNIGGAATTVEIGAATGTTNVNNNLDVDGDINTDGGDITTSATTFNLANANATTVNAFGAATSIDIGAATGTTSINNNLDVDGDVNVDGSDITTNSASFNLINTNAATVNAFGAATVLNIGASGGTVTFAEDVAVGGNLTVTGTTTFNGGTVTIGDAATDNVVFGADVDSSIEPNVDGLYDLGSSSQEWRDLYIDGTAHIDTLDVDENASITGTLGVTGGSTFTGLVTANGGITADGGVFTVADTTGNIHTSGTLDVDGDANFDSNIQVDGNITVVGDITLGGGVFSVDSSTGEVTSSADLNGASGVFSGDLSVTGTSTLTGATTVTGQLNANGGINADNGKFVVADTTGNVSTAGTLSVTGATTLSSTLAVTGNQTNTGDLAVNGGDLTTTAGTFNLINTNATTANIAGAATSVNIGASTGTLTVNNAQTIFDSTDSIQIPVGTTAQRDGTPLAGQIRYNTTTSSFEGYGPGNAWGSLGGVKDVDGDTYLLTEVSAGSDEDTFEFYNAGTNTMSLGSGALTMNNGTYIQLDTSASAPSHGEGKVFWDSDYSTLAIYNSESQVTHQLGQEQLLKVYNNTGSTITDGSAVYITGTFGEYATVAPADASDSAKYNSIGLATHSIETSTYGFVSTYGMVHGLNTINLTAGQPVYVSTTTPGGLTSTPPTYPNFPLVVGFCLSSDASDGEILVFKENQSLGSLRVVEDAYFGGNFVIDGNVTINGTQTITNVTTPSYNSPFVYLNSGDAIGQSNTTHSGTGLDDAWFTGYYEGADSGTTYYVRIDGVGAGTGGVDTFEWSTDNFATTEATDQDVPDGQVELSKGIYIRFESQTGHTLNDSWSGTATPNNVDTGWSTNRNTGGSGVGYTHMGVFWDTSESKFRIYSEYDLEPNGTIDTNDASYVPGPLEVGALETKGNTAVTGNISATGNLSINGTSTLSGNSAIGGTLTVTGATTLNSNVDINGNLDVSGNITSSSGAISFGNENLSTTGTLSAGNSSFGTITGSSLNLSTGAVTAGSLDISGNADIDGTMEADAYTVNGTPLSTYIKDTVGNDMVSGNTESGISVTYDTVTDTLDFNVNDFSITLTGDVTGTGTVTNLGNVSFATTIAANSVALGTDTTGAYVADVVAGSGISLSETNSGGENNTVTVSHADTSSVSNLSSNNSGNTFIQDLSFTFDTYGHVTGASAVTATVNPYDGWTLMTNGTSRGTISENEVVQFSEGGAIDISYGTTNNTITIAHQDTSSQASVNNSGRTYIQDITLDSYGHITGITSATETVVNTDTNNYVSSASFSTSNGVLTLNRSGLSAVTVDLDGRYATSSGVTSVATSGGLTGGTITSTGTVSISSDARPNSNQYFGNSGGEYTYYDNSNAMIRMYINSDEEVRIQNGEAHFEGTVIACSSTTSDERLKTNIQKIENPLDILNAMSGYTFEYKKDGRKAYGLIAQEVEAVCPEMVKDAEVIEGEEEYKVLEYTQMIGVLVEAIKDQQKQIDELKAKLGE
jgi:hypothetical protein